MLACARQTSPGVWTCLPYFAKHVLPDFSCWIRSIQRPILVGVIVGPMGLLQKLKVMIPSSLYMYWDLTIVILGTKHVSSGPMTTALGYQNVQLDERTMTRRYQPIHALEAKDPSSCLATHVMGARDHELRFPIHVVKASSPDAWPPTHLGDMYSGPG